MNKTHLGDEAQINSLGLTPSFKVAVKIKQRISFKKSCLVLNFAQSKCSISTYLLVVVFVPNRIVFG